MSENTTNESRRGFLKLAGVAAPAAAAATLTSGEAEAASDAPEQGEGLRMTPHVKAYLDSARF